MSKEKLTLCKVKMEEDMSSIIIPFIGGLAAPNQGLFPLYDSGEYARENTTMIVSRGIGNSIIPFRINNRPEIVLIDLISA